MRRPGLAWFLAGLWSGILASCVFVGLVVGIDRRVAATKDSGPITAHVPGPIGSSTWTVVPCPDTSGGVIFTAPAIAANSAGCGTSTNGCVIGMGAGANIQIVAGNGSGK